VLTTSDIKYPVKVTFSASLRGELRKVALQLQLGEDCWHLVNALFIAATGNRDAISEIESALSVLSWAEGKRQLSIFDKKPPKIPPEPK